MTRDVTIDRANPHGTLGAHPQDGGVVVRAFRPEAESVRVRLEGKRTVELKPAAEPGLFEGFVEGATVPLRYELNNRPDWVQIPVAGIARLLEAPL